MGSPGLTQGKTEGRLYTRPTGPVKEVLFPTAPGAGSGGGNEILGLG